MGNSVNIWSDPWLPDSLNPYVETSPMVGLEQATVDFLKSSEGRGWDYDILEELFNQRDKELILQIPIMYKEIHDCWHWIWDNKGKYFVKNGYMVLMSTLSIILG